MVIQSLSKKQNLSQEIKDLGGETSMELTDTEYHIHEKHKGLMRGKLLFIVGSLRKDFMFARVGF